jgi:ketosteroid isomerase-like protein
MSQENVEIVRRSVDAWNRRDVEGALGLVNPDAEYVNPPSAVEPGTRRGISELTAGASSVSSPIRPGSSPGRAQPGRPRA